jgi:hypothetical protein
LYPSFDPFPLIKVSDISNPTRPWEQSAEWNWRISDEFFLQGDLEGQVGITPAVHMNRQTASPAQGSISFIQFICRPLFETVVEWLPAFQGQLNQMNENEDELKDMLEREQDGQGSEPSRTDVNRPRTGGNRPRTGDNRLSRSTKDQKKIDAIMIQAEVGGPPAAAAPEVFIPLDDTEEMILLQDPLIAAGLATLANSLLPMASPISVISDDLETPAGTFGGDGIGV